LGIQAYFITAKSLTGQQWPYDMFLDMKMIDGQQIPRFEFLGEMSS